MVRLGSPQVFGNLSWFGIVKPIYHDVKEQKNIQLKINLL